MNLDRRLVHSTTKFFQGFCHAYNLLGQFLLLNKDEEMFVDWLKDEFGMAERYAKSTSNCLTVWCEYNL